MLKLQYSRRGLMRVIAVFSGAWLFGTKASAADRTPSASEGPFYPTGSMRMEDVDNDLVKVTGLVREAGGEVIILKGQVLDHDGQPRQGMRVEIWQCDVNGKYLHGSDRRAIAYDTGFQGFGHDITGPDGSYRFRTIKPAVYPGRTPHIHVKVLDGTDQLLTTQFYLPDHPGNARDRLFNRMSDAEKELVSMVFVSGSEPPETTVNIVV